MNMQVVGQKTDFQTLIICMVFTDETIVVVIKLVSSRFEADELLPHCYTIKMVFLLTKLATPNEKKTCELNFIHLIKKITNVVFSK